MINESLKNTLLQEAETIGQSLIKASQKDQNGLRWMTIRMFEKGKIDWMTHGNVYNGGGGIVLFLNELYRQTGKTEYLEAAKKGAAWAENSYNGRNFASSSALTGPLSVAFVYLKLFQSTHDDYYLKKVQEIANQKLELLLSLKLNEYLNGLSSYLLLLLHLYTLKNEDWILQTMDKCNEKIFSNAFIGKRGLCWDRSASGIHGLCGFSHGASGIGFVFIEQGRCFRNNDFFWLAQNAYEYERQFFSQEKRNWLDFRKGIFGEHDKQQFADAFRNKDLHFFTAESYITAWCHGAPGIGLARLRAYEVLGDKRYKQEALACLECITEDYRQNKQRSYTLCHGYGGNAETLLEGYRVFKDPKFYNTAVGIAESCMLEKNRTGFYASGIDQKIEDLSLFNGIAGIGYFYLRVIFLDDVESLLAPRIREESIADERKPVTFPPYPNKILRANFRRSFCLADHFFHPETQEFTYHIGSKIQFDLKTLWSEFIMGKLNRLSATTQKAFVDILTLEMLKLEIDHNIKSDALLEYENALKFNFGSTFTITSKDDLGDLIFACDQDVLIHTHKFNWSNAAIASDWINNVNVAPSEYFTLLKPTSQGTREYPLSPFSAKLFNLFKRGLSVHEAIKIIIGEVEVSTANDRSEIESVTRNQIFEFLKCGFLRIENTSIAKTSS